jgi:hypothetical protein
LFWNYDPHGAAGGQAGQQSQWNRSSVRKSEHTARRGRVHQFRSADMGATRPCSQFMLTVRDSKWSGLWPFDFDEIAQFLKKTCGYSPVNSRIFRRHHGGR